MRKAQKKQVEDFIKLLGQAHDEIEKFILENEIQTAIGLLGQCQEGAVELGNLIEKEEGEGFGTIALLEDYCELLYRFYEELAQDKDIDVSQLHKTLQEALVQIENSVRNDIKARLEVVFLPYKASMWDSMESIWQAADADPDCNAYVVPIPYYDRARNGMPERRHYEGDGLPSCVPVTHYNEYPLREKCPDVIYIHNPYDYANYVTSVSPEFYSSELKKYTECLVYVPYYSTTGGMSEGQTSCPAYYNADYIIIQAEKYRKFFDLSLPKEKLVPLGSPKFDRIIRMCANPPEPPAEWKEKLKGKRVYFYNTSIGGMLGNTERFLKKMQYVFDCFEGREDVCLLWRPHPLLESTFDSMRKDYKPQYDALKQKFIDRNIGIYDDTSDITSTIALCDAYIGDSGTSVTSLFGMAGKPQFILDNNISSVPKEEDWRGVIVRGFPVLGGVRDGLPSVEKDAWMLTQGNKLYRSRNNEETFRYFCDLSRYSGGGYYGGPVCIDGKIYMYPINAEEILVIGESGIERKIKLEHQVERSGAFYSAVVVGQYLFLIPNYYPAIVRYDTKTDKVAYLEINKSAFIGIADGERRCGAVGVKGDNLYLASPVGNRVLVIDAETGGCRLKTLQGNNPGGYMGMASLPDDPDFWLLPYSGNVVTRWNPETEAVREYPVSLDGFVCHHISFGHECMDRPFGSAVFYKNDVYLSPCWGNMFIRLNKDTGEIKEWIPSIKVPEKEENGYFVCWAKGYLSCLMDGTEIKEYRLFSGYDRKLYKVDFETDTCQEIEVLFDVQELREQEPGFKDESQWLLYCCKESAFNSLPDLLDGKTYGAEFDKEQQIAVYRELSANSDGTCGEKIHQFVCGKF